MKITNLVLLILIAAVTAFFFLSTPQQSSLSGGISDNFSYAILDSEVSYLKLKKDSNTAHAALEKANAYWTRSNTSVNLGVSDSPYWFKYTLKSRAKQALSLVLQNSYAPTDYVSMYTFNAQGEQIQFSQAGDHVYPKVNTLPSSTAAFPIIIKPNEELTILIKVQTQGNYIVPLSLWTMEAFTNYQVHYYFVFGTLIGILLITALHNFFVFTQTNNTMFSSFAFFIFTVMFLVTHQSGIALQFIWPSWSQFNQFAAVMSINLAAFGHLLFSSRFLAFTNKSLLISRILSFICLILVCFYWLFDYSTMVTLSLINGMLMLSITLVIAIQKFAYKEDAALLYLISWSPFILGVLLSAAIRFEFIEYSIYSEFSGVFLAVATIVWLSLAIAKLINKDKTARIRAQKKAIDYLQRYEDLYENAVEGLFNSTIDGRLLRCNKSFANILGYANKIDLKTDVGNNVSIMYRDPKDRAELMSKLLAHGSVIDHEVEFLRQNKQSFWASLNLRLVSQLTEPDKENTPQTSTDDSTLVQGALIDITGRKVSEMKLSYLASHDPLTNLINRREFELKLKEALSDPVFPEQSVTMMYMDLDQFKIVNDTCGHTVGDQLLKRVTALFQSNLRHQGILARLGGDEFGVILKNKNAKEAYAIADNLLQALAKFRFTHNKQSFSVGMSVGIVQATNELNTLEAIMSFADTACYAAKNAGRNCIHLYSDNNEEFDKHKKDILMVNVIEQALLQNNFMLFKQKIVHNDATKALYGYEILLRMQHVDGKYYSPADFIPVAERFGLMVKIDKWVIKQSLFWLSSHIDEINSIETLSINLSGSSVGNNDIMQWIEKYLHEYKVPPQMISFEITETQAIENFEQTVAFIQHFQKRGCKFSLDDFGSGLASYGYLKELPIDHVKIDGRFIKDIATDKTDYALVKSIQTLARAMNKKTIAEFVENDVIIEKLQEIGVDYLQGYAIHKPEAVND
ncbi:EAL domain-containing protein [Glaciecola sp. 2405UD65-10]|uniref:EAL domain-containing protein n=1 Tax=Glaciecola sp. 2405UD65-10 TaxID=3397244 RepID=UPI003B597A9A